MPEAAPLGDYSPASLTLTSSTPAPVPVAFTVSGDPGPDLAQVAPAPPETRDPHEPFEAGQEDQLAGVQVRDPREPIVTESINGTPDFAPPTGKPVAVTGPSGANWAPPTGVPVAAGAWGARVAPTGRPDGNVGAIARQGRGVAPNDPYAQFTAMRMAPGPAVPTPPWGAPTAAPPYYGNLPPGMVPRYRPAQRPDVEARAQYRSYSGGGKLGFVLQSVPWPAFIILVAGIVIPGWAVLAFVITWVITTSSAKVARTAVNRTFMVAAGVYVLVWFLSTVTQSLNSSMFFYDLYTVIGRVICACLMLVLPLIVWRGLASE